MKNLKKFYDFTNESKDEELDRILDKISEFGIESITPEEKSYLDGEREPEYDGLYDDHLDEIYLNPKKENFLFKVYSIDTSQYYSPSDIGVSVFEKTGKYSIDAHVVDEIFHELRNLGLGDLAEGELEYSGKLSKEQLVDKLISMGYKAISI